MKQDLQTWEGINRIDISINVIFIDFNALSFSILFYKCFNPLVFILNDSDVSLANPLTFLEWVNLVFQRILVLVELHLRSDQSIENQLRLIDEFCGNLVDGRINLEWGFRFKVGWLDGRRLLLRQLRLTRVQIRVTLLDTWGRTSHVWIVRWLLLLLGRHSTVWLLGELTCKSCWGTWEVRVLRTPIRILTWHWSWKRCILLWGKEALTCSIHHCSLKTLFRGWIIRNNRLNKAHQFSQVRLLLWALRTCPITQIRHFDLVLCL